MKNLKKTLLAMAVSATAFSMSATAEEQTFMEAMKDSKATLGFRYRFEDVSQDGLEDSTANTLRTRLNFATGSYQGFSGFVEFDQVSELIEVDYRTSGGDASNPGTAVIADPEITDWNQGYAQYKAAGVTAKYGRQRILLDNQRFVGGVGWRQNEQTFDALSAVYAPLENLTLTYAHVTNVNTIFGTNRDAKDDLINAKYSVSDAAVITAYGYFLSLDDIDNTDDDTIGAKFSGKAAGFEYAAEYAQQDAYKSGTEYSATYLALTGSYKISGVKIGAGYEVLGADGANGEFETAYGTKHAFQGWADKFLNTPNGGIVDAYASIGGKIGPVTAAAIYHEFESDDDSVGAGDLGSEIDIVIKGKAGPVGLMLKYADYKAGDINTDTQKLWLMATLAI